MRHRSTPVSTCQRYALAVHRVNSASTVEWPGRGGPSPPAETPIATTYDHHLDHPGNQCRVFGSDTPQPVGFAPYSLWTTVDPQVRKLLASGVPGNPQSSAGRTGQSPGCPAQSRCSGATSADTMDQTGRYRRRSTSNRDNLRNKAQPVDKGVEPRDPGLRDGTAKEWERNEAWMQDRAQERTRQASSRSSGRGSWTVSLPTNGSGWHPASR